MSNRLSIFEFVSYKNIPDYVSELLREISLTEGLEERLTVQQRQGLIDRGSQLINNLEAALTTRPVPNFETAIQPSYISLQRDLIPLIGKELGAKFNTLELHLAQIYPNYFQDRQDLLQAGQLANNNSTIMPMDPSIPAPGQSIDADSLAPVNQRTTFANRTQQFNSALGLDNIKNTFGSPEANKINVPVRKP
jgi:hypothetical protein